MPIEHLFRQRADQGLAREMKLVTLLGLTEDLGDMKWAWRGSEYVFNHCNMRSALLGARFWPEVTATQGPQSPELTFRRCCEYFKEILTGSGCGLRFSRCHGGEYSIEVGICQM